ncbi:MAG TPA: ERF family protein [Bacillales bacterium]
MADEKKLIGKLVSVMNQVKYIEKKGFNNFNKYKYATEADVNEKVREYLAEQGVMMIPNMKSYETREHKNRKGNTEYIGTAEIEFTFYDGETGESISFTVYGEGQDAGDKAVYKAITGAQKYALMKSFMIPTGDDPERDEKPQSKGNKNEPTITQKTFGTLKTKWLENADEKQLNTFVKKHYGCEPTKLTERQGIELLERISKKESA